MQSASRRLVRDGTSVDYSFFFFFSCQLISRSSYSVLYAYYMH